MLRRQAGRQPRSGEAPPAPPPDRPGFLRRVLPGRLAVAGGEVAHGILRAAFLLPVVGDLPSRRLGVFTGALRLLAVAWVVALWIRVRSPRALFTAAPGGWL